MYTLTTINVTFKSMLYKLGYILNPSIDMPFTCNKAFIDFALVAVI